MTVTIPPEFLRKFPSKEHSTGWAIPCPDRHATSGFSVIARPDETAGFWRFECVDAVNGDLCGNERELVRLLGLTESEIRLVSPAVAVVPVEEFAAVREASAEPLIGTEEDTVLAAGGTAMLYGEGGAGKTTGEIDLAFHVATGLDWLALNVTRRARGLILEAEGPRGKMRTKLAAKLAAWDGPDLDGWLHVVESPWATLSLANPKHRAMLAQAIVDTDAEIVYAGPVSALGLQGGGTPAEVRDFVAHLEDIRALVGRPVAFVLIAHENKAGQVSGAWEGATDTLAHVQAMGNGKSRLFWKKARWAPTLHGAVWHLLWRDGETFDLEDKPETTDGEIAQALLDYVTANPSQSWRNVENELPGKNVRKRELRDRLLEDGQLVNVPKGNGMQLFAKDAPGIPEACRSGAHPGAHLVPLPDVTDESGTVPRAAPIGHGTTGTARSGASDKNTGGTS